MNRKRIVSHVQTKPEEADAWENTAQFEISLPEPDEPEEPEIKKSVRILQNPDMLWCLVPVLILILVIILMLNLRSLHDTQIAETSVTEETQSIIGKETIRIEIPSEPPSENPTERSDYSDFSALVSNIYADYATALADSYSTICKGGYLTDLNQDGLDEMILFADIEPECYVILTYQNQAVRVLDTFGSYSTYLYFNESCLYRITGRDNSIYLYYQDSFDKQSISGYYSIRNRNALSVLTEYGLSRNNRYKVKWHIFYTDTETDLLELNSGSTIVDALYEVPDGCQKKTENYLADYHFYLSAADQNRLDFLYYDELINTLQKLSAQ